VRRVSLNRVRGRLLGSVVFLVAIALWETWARLEPSFLFPPVSAVADRAWHVWPTSEFLTTVAAPSLKRLAAGYTIGAGVGIAVGVVIGTSPQIRRLLDPLVEILRATPPIAIVPAAILILGFGDSMRISVIAFGVLFPVLVNTVDGVRAVSPETRDIASLLRLGRVDRILRVYLPAATPSIFAGLRFGLSVGLVMVVISEFVGGSDGVGYYIDFQQSQSNVAEVYGGILFLGLLGYVLNTLFLLVERHALAWHYGAAGEPDR
jgi:ABC-type nitrate/sulfonate/bicarbonate transport system permease component